MPVYSAVYDALVKYDKDKGVKAGLAENGMLMNQEKSEFHLKRTLNFRWLSFRCKAVKFSIERAKAMNKRYDCRNVKKLDKVVIKSDHVVQIRLKSPSNQVLNELTQVRPDVL